MTDTTTQAAVDATDATAKPVADVNNAQDTGDDLDTLLSQYEAQTAKAAPASPPQTPQVTQPQTPSIDADRVRRIEDRLFKQDLDEAVSGIVGDLKVPRRMATGWLDQMARERPAIANAFMQKDSNPQGWKQVQQSLAREFAREVESVSYDKNVSEDRSAVAAAVRGASTKAPTEPPPNYSSLSNSEIREEYRKLGINPTF